LEFVEKWANKKSSSDKIRREFIKDYIKKIKKFNEYRDLFEKKQKYKNEEYNELINNTYGLLATLSPNFQNIHIAQLVKLVEEDKRNTIDINDEAKTFNFWLFFQSKISMNGFFNF
jgi:esterase/lipase